MSITALILIQTVNRRAKLTVRHGRAAVEMSLFVTAARLIAGEYEN
jgi:hypothetical protein